MTPTETAELMQAVADVVQDQVALALRDMATKLAIAETKIAALSESEKSLNDVIHRLIVVETKSSAPVERDPVDLSPVLERLAVAEARIKQLPEAEKSIGEMRDRLLVFETKAALAPAAVEAEPVDLAPVLATVAELRASVDAKIASLMTAEKPIDLTPVIERLSAVERTLDARAADTSAIAESVKELRTSVDAKIAGLPVPKEPDFKPVMDRLNSVERSIETKATEVAPIVAGLADVTKDVVMVRERLTAVETRAAVPGPAGPSGKDGHDGKDGADGLGFDDLVAVQNDDRSFTIKAQRGDRIKEIGTARFPVQIQRGVYQDGKSYESGDVVTWAGSQWHCNADTNTKPGNGSKAWTLVVKCGRDGKDGRDAVTTPVVSLGRPS